MPALPKRKPEFPLVTYKAMPPHRGYIAKFDGLSPTFSGATAMEAEEAADAWLQQAQDHVATHYAPQLQQAS